MTNTASDSKQASPANDSSGVIGPEAPRRVVKALLDDANFPYFTRHGRVWVVLAAAPGADVTKFLRRNWFQYYAVFGAWVHSCGTHTPSPRLAAEVG